MKQKKLYYFPQKHENRGMQMNQFARRGRLCSTLVIIAAGSLLAVGASVAFAAPGNVKPPPGFTALFNGEDLTGWRGGDTFDHRKLLAMPAEEREAHANQGPARASSGFVYYIRFAGLPSS